MRIPVLLMMAATVVTARTDQVPFYVGTNSQPGNEPGILLASLDSKSGELTGGTSVAEAQSPSFLAVSDNGQFLFAAVEQAEGAVRAYRIGPSHQLEFLNEQPSGGKGACHVWFGAGHVFVSNYSSGSIACFPVGGDGRLGAATATISFEGSGPNVSRQKQAHAHAMQTSGDGNFAYACDLGSDSIWSFRFNASDGHLTPTDPPAGKVTPGGGPRHLAISPTKPFLYSNDEMGLAVSVFSRDPQSGVLRLIQSISTLPSDANREGVSTAAIALHPSGRWLYVSNRGHDSITVFEVQPDGLLRFVENVPATVAFPRGFSLDPLGQWLVVAGQKDGGLASLKIDPNTGRLSPSHRITVNAVPVCVTFAPPQG